MLELGSICAQHIEPIIDVFAKAFQVGAAREFLQSFNSSIFDCVRASLKLNVEQTPHFEAVSMLASSQWNSPSVHILGEPIHQERLQHRGDVPSVDTFDVVVHQPGLGYRRWHLGCELQSLAPEMGGSAHVINHALTPHLKV